LEESTRHGCHTTTRITLLGMQKVLIGPKHVQNSYRMCFLHLWRLFGRVQAVQGKSRLNQVSHPTCMSSASMRYMLEVFSLITAAREQ
jgi:hypothetical protein